MKLWHYLSGCDRFTFDHSLGERVMELLFKYNIHFFDLSLDEEKGLSFSVYSFRKKRCLRVFEWENCKDFTVTPFGLRLFLKKHKNRVGLLMGAVLFSWILSLCSSLVWDISYDGAPLQADLEAAFSKAGLYRGMLISDFDSDAFKSRFLSENPQYSYVSAGIHGCRAYVWLNERSNMPPVDSIKGASNLVAEMDGYIVRCEAVNGEVKVKHGDPVYKGQLLVSGIVEMKNGAYKIEEASGKVFAVTQREFKTELLLNQEEKIYTGREKTKIFVNILGKNINFLNFSGNLYEFYDTIEEREEIYLFDSFKLPFYLVKRCYAEYSPQASCIDPEKAKDICYDRYYEFLNALDAESVLGEELEFRQEKDSVTLNVKLSLIEDIALSKPFGFKELNGEP